MRYSVYEVASWFLTPMPALKRMRGHPEYHRWAAGLVELSRTPGLETLYGVLQAIADEALETTDPLNTFAQQEAQAVPFETYLQAGRLAEEASAGQPEAAYILALVALMGWGVKLGADWGVRPEGGSIQYYCWVHLPYSLSLASLWIGGVTPARRLMELSFDVLNQVATRYFWKTELMQDITRQRALYNRIQKKYEIAVSNLGDDLRESCREPAPNFRAEAAALLWALGHVPESQLLRAGSRSDYFPSRRLCNLIVRQSLEAIPHDPLVQYIWLSLKDRPPFDLRSHEELYPVFDTVYDSSRHLSWSFVLEPDAVYRLYTQTLTGWMRGDLEPDIRRKYFDLMSDLALMVPDIDPSLINERMAELGYVLGFESGLDFSAGELEIWQAQARDLSHFRKVLNSHPEIPDARGRMNLPFFYLVERWLGMPTERQGEPAEIEKVYAVVEQFRAGALAYWLRANAPFPSRAEREALGPLLAEEDKLLEQLRGAYLLVLLPLLPSHFQYHDSSLEDIFQRQREPEKYGFDPDTGRREYEEIHADLVELYGRMEARAPEYARKRKDLAAGLADLRTCLAAHRRPA